MTQTPREAAEDMRDAAAQLCEDNVWTDGELTRGGTMANLIRALPLHAAPEPTAEGRTVLDDIEVKQIEATAVEIVERIRDENLKYVEMIYLVSEPLFTIALSEKAARADLARKEDALSRLRLKAIPAGGAAVRRCEGWQEMCVEVLDIIDGALK